MNRLPGYARPEIDIEKRKVLHEALTTGSSNYLTICEQLRFIYDTVDQLPDSEMKEDIVSKLEVAFDMGKKMNSRLAYYRKTYNSDRTGSKGSGLLLLDHTEERVRLRAAR